MLSNPPALLQLEAQFFYGGAGILHVAAVDFLQQLIHVSERFFDKFQPVIKGIFRGQAVCSLAFFHHPGSLVKDFRTVGLPLPNPGKNTGAVLGDMFRCFQAIVLFAQYLGMIFIKNMAHYLAGIFFLKELLRVALNAVAEAL